MKTEIAPILTAIDQHQKHYGIDPSILVLPDNFFENSSFTCLMIRNIPVVKKSQLKNFILEME